MIKQTNIYFSYAWSDSNEKETNREELVNRLYDSLLSDGFNVVRDKVDLSYKGSITEFMESIGKGEAIIVVISDKYVKSPYCMFELYEIARNSKFSKEEFTKKIYPIFIEFIDFANPAILSTYYDYWEETEKSWKDLIDKRGDKLSIEQFKKYDKTKLIHQNIGQLMDWIIDLNTLNPQLLSENNFEIIKNSLINKFPITSTQKSAENMNQSLKEQLLELVADGNFENAFTILHIYRKEMSSNQRPTFNLLKGEFEFKGNHNKEYSQRVTSFINTLEFEKK
jgi:hypothetical protein